MPRTYAPSSTFTLKALIWSIWRYITSSGVNSFPPHATANRAALTRIQGTIAIRSPAAAPSEDISLMTAAPGGSS